MTLIDKICMVLIIVALVTIILSGIGVVIWEMWKTSQVLTIIIFLIIIAAVRLSRYISSK